MLRCGVSSVVSACIFALCKLLLFYNYVCRVDLLAFTVGVASGLNAAGDGDLRSLTQVFLCKFCLAAESNASDKVCGCGIAVSAESAVNSQCITGYRCGVLSAEYLTSGSLVNLPINITLFIRLPLKLPF